MSSKDQFVFTLRGGLKMPALGLGTYAPKEDDDDVFNAVHTAVKVGYRHLDCAAIYRNEIAVGSAIKKLIIEGTVQREDLFITSKLWNTCHRPDLVRASLKKSLDDLGLKYLDMYLIHWPMAYKEGGEFHPRDENGKVLFSDVDYVDTWKALEDCVDEGLVRNIGVSNFSSKQLQRILDKARIKPQINQVECHLHLSNSKLQKYCQENGVVLQAYAPLGSSGNKTEPPPKCLEEPVLLEIAKAKNKTPAQVTLRYLLQRGLSLVPKSVTPQRIQENFQIFDFELSSDEEKQLQNLNKDFRMHTEDM
ncbi:aldo-keto reductase family 1 member B1-like [Mercenaria mercenaria]|uniref:aldo-keto reductase family 1 member B1-like n=1 Tax=Mercenaria mercenaria TaxID=6596 RepID=UPI00234F4FBA|nr:aldo-keto reductase family 1 member B1-like [Mercenaria mercenaria]